MTSIEDIKAKIAKKRFFEKILALLSLPLSLYAILYLMSIQFSFISALPSWPVWVYFLLFFLYMLSIPLWESFNLTTYENIRYSAYYLNKFYSNENGY